MLETALFGETAMVVSRIEETTSRPSYTLDTVRALRKKHPQVEFVFIIGAEYRESVQNLALLAGRAARSSVDCGLPPWGGRRRSVVVACRPFQPGADHADRSLRRPSSASASNTALPGSNLLPCYRHLWRTSFFGGGSTLEQGREKKALPDRRVGDVLPGVLRVARNPLINSRERTPRLRSGW